MLTESAWLFPVRFFIAACREVSAVVCLRPSSQSNCGRLLGLNVQPLAESLLNEVFLLRYVQKTR